MDQKSLMPTIDAAELTRQLLAARAGQPVTERDKRLFLTLRQAHIMMIGAIEDYLGMERSIPPKHKR